MLEFFVIFSKSGIVLFATTVNESLTSVINGLVKHVFLEERTGQYQTDQLQLKYQMDNEFELVFVVGYQKFLQLSYVDKLLDSMKLAFRDKYSDFDLRRILNVSFAKQTSKLLKLKSSEGNHFKESIKKSTKRQKLTEIYNLVIDLETNILDFSDEFSQIYSESAKSFGTSKAQEKTMRTFQDSAKSQKTIASMIVQPGKVQPAKELAKLTAPTPQQSVTKPIAKPAEANVIQPTSIRPGILGKIGEDGGPLKPKFVANNKAKAKSDAKKQKQAKTKAARQWDLAGSNPDEFDFSKKPANSDDTANASHDQVNTASMKKNIIAGDIGPEDMETNLAMTDDESSDEDVEDDLENGADYEDDENDGDAAVAGKISKSSYFGSIWKRVSYNKELSEQDLRPVLDQLRDHLTSKNVAAQIAEEICDNICEKLKGLQVNTWLNLKKFARNALEEAILRILNPSKNINILREVQAKQKPPYVIVLCGVNGVGKSTNLAKIANWLIVNKIKVLVVAGDTFRAGAIEQLKTHVMALKAIHERGKNSDVKIELFDDGYNKDPDSVARKAIAYARSGDFKCVIVDTAGRMQDNEPLMKQLAKLIKSNNPDLTLFVGEALVGNEAVDQLSKFNNSLVDNGCQLSDSARSAINGIVLTKFDTIDDQVGAAISMTYVTGKPIVFVGVGQTYRDLKQLDAKAVTKALMR